MAYHLFNEPFMEGIPYTEVELASAGGRKPVIGLIPPKLNLLTLGYENSIIQMDGIADLLLAAGWTENSLEETSSSWFGFRSQTDIPIYTPSTSIIPPVPATASCARPTQYYAQVGTTIAAFYNPETEIPNPLCTQIPSVPFYMDDSPVTLQWAPMGTDLLTSAENLATALTAGGEFTVTVPGNYIDDPRTGRAYQFNAVPNPAFYRGDAFPIFVASGELGFTSGGHRVFQSPTLPGGGFMKVRLVGLGNQYGAHSGTPAQIWFQFSSAPPDRWFKQGFNSAYLGTHLNADLVPVTGLIPVQYTCVVGTCYFVLYCVSGQWSPDHPGLNSMYAGILAAGNHDDGTNCIVIGSREEDDTDPDQLLRRLDYSMSIGSGYSFQETFTTNGSRGPNPSDVSRIIQIPFTASRGGVSLTDMTGEPRITCAYVLAPPDPNGSTVAKIAGRMYDMAIASGTTDMGTTSTTSEKSIRAQYDGRRWTKITEGPFASQPFALNGAMWIAAALPAFDDAVTA